MKKGQRVVTYGFVTEVKAIKQSIIARGKVYHIMIIVPAGSPGSLTPFDLWYLSRSPMARLQSHLCKFRSVEVGCNLDRCLCLCPAVRNYRGKKQPIRYSISCYSASHLSMGASLRNTMICRLPVMTMILQSK